ncbi:MAG TPA: hypothetical protein VGO62_01360 [Myxococcota bacterium]
MKLDLGPFELNLPQGVFLPTLVIAAGEEDKADAMALGPTVKKAQVQSFRRTVSVSVLPLKTDKSDGDMIDEEIQKFIKGAGAKLVSVTDRDLCGAKAKIVEAKLNGPNNTPLVTLGCVSFGHGFLFTVILTVLDGKTLGAARQDFTRMVEEIKLGSLSSR